MNLTAAQLRAIMPHLPEERAVFWLPRLQAAMVEFLITTPARAAAFLAQAAHESGELARLVENLNYGAVGLRRTWPTRFPDGPTSLRYARKPQEIAEKVYGGRLGNGPAGTGDGWKFRGRGVFQLTGRANYRDAGKALVLPLEDSPELLEHPQHASRSAGWFWQSRGLSMLVDAGEAVADQDGPLEAFKATTKRINGGLIGLPERLEYWHRALKALA